MYVACLQCINVGEIVDKHPFLFGVCHGYKMILLRVHIAYRPLCSALQFITFLIYRNIVSVLRAHDLIHMERTVLAVLFAAPRLSISLRRSIVGGLLQVGKLRALVSESCATCGLCGH